MDAAVQLRPPGLAADAGGIELALRSVDRGVVKGAPLLVGHHVTGNQFQYEWNGIREWYRNTPGGVEHGFDIWERSPGHGPLLVRLGVTGAVALQASDGVTLMGTGASRLRYDRLSVMDALGRAVPSRLIATNDGIVMEVDDRRALYPLAIDPYVWVEGDELIPGEMGSSALFGYSVSASDDGERLLVGAPGYDTPATDGGAAVLYAEQGGTWMEVAVLQPADIAQGDLFAFSVGLSGDGRTAVLSAPNDSDDGASSGSAYVFEELNGVWVETSKLTAQDAAAGAAFGRSVVMSKGGTTAIVGAIGDSGTALEAGAAYIFTKSGSNWNQVQKLVASDAAAGDFLGLSVALTRAEDLVFVGAPNAHGGAAQSGATYVFEKQGATWEQRVRLTPDDPTQEGGFGASVALSETGDRLVVGAVGAGAAYVFQRVNDAWQQEARLPGTGADDWAGFAVGMMEDGEAILVGAPGFRDLSEPTKRLGQVLAFERREPGNWVAESSLRPSNLSGAVGFGTSIALTAKGEWGFVGGHLASSQRGSLFTFRSRYEGRVGESCTGDEDCQDGHCVDMVCCVETCGGRDDDCQACSASLTGLADGVCGPILAQTTCRASTDACDAEEQCDGIGLDCPDDVVVQDGTPCDDSDPCTAGDSCSEGMCMPGAASCATGGSSPSSPEPPSEANGCSCSHAHSRDSRGDLNMTLLFLLLFLRRRYH